MLKGCGYVLKPVNCLDNKCPGFVLFVLFCAKIRYQTYIHCAGDVERKAEMPYNIKNNKMQMKNFFMRNIYC